MEAKRIGRNFLGSGLELVTLSKEAGRNGQTGLRKQVRLARILLGEGWDWSNLWKGTELLEFLWE